MTSLVYQTKKNGPWHTANLKLTVNDIQEICLKQKRLGYAKYNKVKITDGKTSIEAVGILFPNGDIWDAALSKFV